MYVERLTIHNFRCFADASLELNYPGRNRGGSDVDPLPSPNVNLFLGDNGSGKSSVFKAVALGILFPVISSSGFQAEYLVRRRIGETDVFPSNANGATDGFQEQTAEIEATLRLNDRDTSTTAINADVTSSLTTGKAVIKRYGDIEQIESQPLSDQKLWQNMYLNDSPSFFVAGYGANRRTERPEGYSEQTRSRRYQRVASLFEDHVGLVPFSYGGAELVRLGYFADARILLNSLLPEYVQLTDKTDKEQRLLFERYGVALPFEALSDGYRTFVGWVWDLLLQLARIQAGPLGTGSAAPVVSTTSGFSRASLTEAAGVVIIDEIDLFLHPEWQRTVIYRIASTFPYLQFLFSTHSPLVAGSLRPENIFVLEGLPDGTVNIANYTEKIYGLTPNQVLTSSYFGLRSTRAPGTGTLTDFARSLTVANKSQGNTESKAQGNGAGDAASDPYESAVSLQDDAEQAEPRDRAIPAVTAAAQRMLDEIGEDSVGEAGEDSGGAR